MFRTFPWRVLAIVGAFLLIAGLETASAEPRERPKAALSIQSAWTAFSDLHDALIAIWSDNGASLDPFGGEKPTSQNGNWLIAIWSDNGAGLDPFGGEKPAGQSGNGDVAPTLERK